MKTDLEQKQQRNRKFTLRIIALGVGVAGGLLCAHLPEHYRGFCQIAAKILTFFIGA